MTKRLSAVVVHDYNRRICKAETDGLVRNGGQLGLLTSICTCCGTQTHMTKRKSREMG